MTRYFYTDPLAAACQITMSDGQAVTVSPEDYEWLSRHSWRPSYSKKKCYAATSIKDGSGKWRKRYMHRLIVKPKGGYQVDHINGRSLDNRRENLRMCNSFQNAHNRGANNGSPIKGVRQENGRWRMTISKTYATQKEAAKAYNELAKQLFGEFAYQNEVEND